MRCLCSPSPPRTWKRCFSLEAWPDRASNPPCYTFLRREVARSVAAEGLKSARSSRPSVLCDRRPTENTSIPIPDRKRSAADATAFVQPRMRPLEARGRVPAGRPPGTARTRRWRGRYWRRAMSEFSGISGVKGRSFPPPSVDKQLPVPEEGVYPSYTSIGHPAISTDDSPRVAVARPEPRGTGELKRNGELVVAEVDAAVVAFLHMHRLEGCFLQTVGQASVSQDAISVR